jgi:CheY-like chemotaxis protein
MRAELAPADDCYDSSSPWRARKGRVLVVDDCPDSAESMAILLRLSGYEVETATGGLSALRAARARRPDVVLLDISMPGMNGYEVARQLRKLFHNDIGLIAVTANGFEEDRCRCLEAGFDCFFVKPADPDEVERALWQLTPVY